MQPLPSRQDNTMGVITSYNASFRCISKISWFTGEKGRFGVPQGFYGVPGLLNLGVLSCFTLKRVKIG